MPDTNYLAYLIRTDDGYHVVDKDGIIGPVCNIVTDEGYLRLSPNAANRKYYSLKKADKHFSKSSEPIGLTYKTTRHLAGVPAKIPNTHLIPYMTSDEQATYMAIVERTYNIMHETGQKSFIDAISDQDYPLYNALLDKAAYLKSLVPHTRTPRKPLTAAQKRKMAEAKTAKARAALAALVALDENMRL